MDILKILINNPGLQHVAEIVIGYMGKEDARNVVGNRLAGLSDHELLSEEEQDVLMKILRKPMYDEAKKICEEKREFYVIEQCYGEDGDVNCERVCHKESIFDMYPYFAVALEELKSSESLLTFKQLQKTLSLLESVITEDLNRWDEPVSKLPCLHKFVPDYQDIKKGPEDMIIKALKDAGDYYWSNLQVYYNTFQ